ncbi:uncharacterized protein LOC109596587 [Aethina tumida]|uniref:uncharacterized protein LOC109596587 n=1 Tax=Aethina tumida TaxID=116153 RepID=UPI00096B0B88|nr:uncharacterized protein LOC109596587 [Aethina tumida]
MEFLRKITLFLLVFLLIQNAATRPGLLGEFPDGVEDKCSDESPTIEVCQRCAKTTKSPLVYPMCCSNQEDAFNWCVRYVNFGNVNKPE